MHFSLPISTAVLLALIPLHAAEKPLKGVDLTLVAEKPVIAAGETVTVGLKIHHLPHYHTYWQNPGIAGVPTSLKWELPPGFTAGPIQWPAPEKTLMAGHPVHGYERDVMLLVDIKAPADLPAGTPVELKAKAAWMACADGCFPGETQVSVTLDGKTAESTLPADFAKARSEMPQPLQGWTATVSSVTGAAEIRLHLSPVSPQIPAPEGLYFFSSDGQVSSDKPQQVTRNGDGSLDLVAVRSEYGPKNASTLPGVLSTTTRFTADGPGFASIAPAYAGAEGAPQTAVATPTAVPAKACSCCEEEKKEAAVK